MFNRISRRPAGTAGYDMLPAEALPAAPGFAPLPPAAYPAQPVPGPQELYRLALITARAQICDRRRRRLRPCLN